ncbi:MAG: DUF1156 domain-containing protein [Leptospiraceae bacterium]|nr:DUF1156 domain-containing protein [Leptospiraceae bacterium]
MKKKLIETAFPLKEVSEHSKGEKSISNGHISSLHRWPARRPLAASRAVLIASLLDDPEDASEEMKAEYAKVTGQKFPVEQRKELCNMITKITKWKTENNPELEIFKSLILKTYNGVPPKLIDPFSGGGSIPLEAMRLGCEVTANDYNPVAVFILKCTLEYPQKFYGKQFPLPDLGLESDKGESQMQLHNSSGKMGDLADHVELWGKWVLEQTKKEIGEFYPEVDGKKTVAYLWARTVPCQDPNCGATIPLLKTLILCDKKDKLRALRLKPNKDTKIVEFEPYTPKDKSDIGKPIMSSANAQCPFCGTIVKTDYIKECGFNNLLKEQMTCAIYQNNYDKEYRIPEKIETDTIEYVKDKLNEIKNKISFSIPNESFPYAGTPLTSTFFKVSLYGLKTYSDLFTDRQLLSIMTFIKYGMIAKEQIEDHKYNHEWINSIYNYLILTINKLIDYNSTICFWRTSVEGTSSTFSRYALPITWDFIELNPFSESIACYKDQLYSIINVLRNLQIKNDYTPKILNQSATDLDLKNYDFCGVTDPPYYDAINYADISDFFYVWLKRMLVNTELEYLTNTELSPKEKELVVSLKNQKHIEALKGERLSKTEYEKGMALAFQKQSEILVEGGIFVVVFANKEPNAWETLVTALIKANFTITASLPIDTEKGGGLRNFNQSALSTSIWMVCRKRAKDAGKGKHVQVIKEMKERITDRLHYFWDEGVRGPDFVWSAIGPALESYSRYEFVKRPDGKEFTVSEFLKEVRRMVTDFALGAILHKESTEGVDAWTSYYLMHRYNFGYDAAPAGECILLSQAYGLDLKELADNNYGILAKSSSNYTLKPYNTRKNDKLGESHVSGLLPLIDMLHRIMVVWKSGDTKKLSEYVTNNNLIQNEIFWKIGQSILEMCDTAKEKEEKTLLESIVSWGKNKEFEKQNSGDQGNLF